PRPRPSWPRSRPGWRTRRPPWRPPGRRRRPRQPRRPPPRWTDRERTAAATAQPTTAMRTLPRARATRTCPKGRMRQPPPRTTAKSLWRPNPTGERRTDGQDQGRAAREGIESQGPRGPGTPARAGGRGENQSEHGRGRRGGAVAGLDGVPRRVTGRRVDAQEGRRETGGLPRGRPRSPCGTSRVKAPDDRAPRRATGNSGPGDTDSGQADRRALHHSPPTGYRQDGGPGGSEGTASGRRQDIRTAQVSGDRGTRSSPGDDGAPGSIAGVTKARKPTDAKLRHGRAPARAACLAGATPADEHRHPSSGDERTGDHD